MLPKSKTFQMTVYHYMCFQYCQLKLIILSQNRPRQMHISLWAEWFVCWKPKSMIQIKLSNLPCYPSHFTDSGSVNGTIGWVAINSQHLPNPCHLQVPVENIKIKILNETFHTSSPWWMKSIVLVHVAGEAILHGAN